jgi:hypothetical protein
MVIMIRKIISDGMKIAPLEMEERRKVCIQKKSRSENSAKKA